MGHTGRDDDDVARAQDAAGATSEEQNPALLDDVDLVAGALRVARQYRTLEAEALEILARRDEHELAAIASFLRDMHELGVHHVARLERQTQRR